MSNLVPVSDIEKMAGAIAKSGFFGMKTLEQAMALMFIAQAEGKHPATAAQEYHVIQGKPALKADAMMARFQAAGGKVEWLAYTDKEVKGKFSHPQGGSVEIGWTIEMATAAKLTGKDTWKQYPRQMLRARVISEGIRTVYPGVAVGVYTPEEVQDFNPSSGGVDNGVVIENAPQIVDTKPYDVDVTRPISPFKTATLRNKFHDDVKDSFNKAINLEEVEQIAANWWPKLEEMQASGDERDSMAFVSIKNTYKLMKARFKTPDPIPSSEIVDEAYKEFERQFDNAVARD